MATSVFITLCTVFGTLDEETVSVIATVTHYQAKVVAMSPSGRWLLTGGSDGIRVWDLPAGATHYHLRAHALRLNAESNNSSVITAIVFAPDEKHFITAGEDGNIVLWAIGRSDPVQVIAEPWVQGDARDFHLLRRVPIQCVAIDVNRQYIVAGTLTTVNMWEMPSGGHLREFGRSLRKEVIPTADLALRSFPVVQVTDLRDALYLPPIGPGRLRDHLIRWVTTTDSDFVRLVAVLSKGLVLAARSHDINVWDLRTGRHVRTLPGSCFAVSPNEEFIVTGGQFAQPAIWSTNDWKEVAIRERGLPMIYLETNRLILKQGAALIDLNVSSNQSSLLPDQPKTGGEVVSVATADNAKVIAAVWSGLTRDNIVVFHR